MMMAMVMVAPSSGLDRIEGAVDPLEPARSDWPPRDGMAVSPSGLDRIEGDSQFARAGSIGLAPEDVNIDVNGGSTRARSIELRIRGFKSEVETRSARARSIGSRLR